MEKSNQRINKSKQWNHPGFNKRSDVKSNKSQNNISLHQNNTANIGKQFVSNSKLFNCNRYANCHGLN